MRGLVPIQRSMLCRFLTTVARLSVVDSGFRTRNGVMTGTLDKPKCRIVAQGFSQIPGIDFNETYASTPKLSTMRFFLWAAISLKFRMEEFGITAAYLHSSLEHLVYMRPPFGLERQDEQGRPLVWKLNDGCGMFRWRLGFMVRWGSIQQGQSS